MATSSGSSDLYSHFVPWPKKKENIRNDDDDYVFNVTFGDQYSRRAWERFGVDFDLLSYCKKKLLFTMDKGKHKRSNQIS